MGLLFKHAGRILALIRTLLRRMFQDPRRLVIELEQTFAPQHQVVDLSTYLHQRPEFTTPLNVLIDSSLEHRPTLNVVLPCLAMENMSGGPNTAINLAYRVAALGVPVRFVSQDMGPGRNLEPLWRHMSRLTGLAPHLPNVEIVDASIRSRGLRIGSRDVFMATAWWTAQNVNLALQHTRTKGFIYLIQDYEPAFYPLSLNYALALDTYSMNYRAVINSKLLAEFFVDQKIGRFRDPDFVSRCSVFDPAVDATRFFPESRSPSSGPHRMTIYARPTAPRNLFEMVAYCINQAAKEGAFSKTNWEVSFAGDNVPDIRLDNGMVVACQKWNDHDANALVMRRSDVVVSLILSSHPSYVPLEAAACGAIVVTNSFLNKTSARLVQLSPNFVPVEPNVDAIVAALKEATRRVEQGLVVRDRALNLPGDWSEAFAETVPAVKAMFEDFAEESAQSRVG